METRRGYREHQVADLVALIAGCASLAVAVWPMTVAGTGEGHEQFRDAFSVQMVHVSAGALAVFGVGARVDAARPPRPGAARLQPIHRAAGAARPERADGHAAGRGPAAEGVG